MFPKASYGGRQEIKVIDDDKWNENISSIAADSE
jgi:hypothetical protein